MYININIRDNFVPNKNTLKGKGSIDKFSVSSSRTQMMRLPSEVSNTMNMSMGVNCLTTVLDLYIKLLSFHDFKNSQGISLSEVLCKLILIIFLFIVSYEGYI